MRSILVALVLCAVPLLCAPPLFAADHDCPGGFQVMRGYRGQGGICAQMGLNSRVGTCLPGQAYEILCDDASGGRYKTCQGPRRCDGRGGYDGRGGPGFAPGRGNGNNDYQSGGGYGRPQRPGGQWNGGGRPAMPTPGFSGNCTSWDFSANRPCPPGRVNRDCRGGCDS
ncbi:MAG: hypothetical protein LBU39_04030 [Desulfobulbaceae bacterium]|nr:hypothetical protein [Desulfobulbaceae bacterium]